MRNFPKQPVNGHLTWLSLKRDWPGCVEWESIGLRILLAPRVTPATPYILYMKAMPGKSEKYSASTVPSCSYCLSRVFNDGNLFS